MRSCDLLLNLASTLSMPRRASGHQITELDGIQDHPDTWLEDQLKWAI